MAIPSIYINLEDDVSKIVTRLKHNPAKQVILVCPKRSYIFSDSINLRLLKKQTDLLGKEIFILTMDEKGQLYAREAGFALKFLPKVGGKIPLSDIRQNRPEKKPQVEEVEEEIEPETPKKASLIENIAPAIVSSVFNVKHVEPEPEEVEVTDNIFPVTEEEEIPGKKRKPKILKIITTTAVISVVLLLALNFLVLPTAEVNVYPKTEIVTRDMVISMTTTAQAIDVDKLVMPAQTLNEPVSLSQKFESQGKSQVGNKATGLIKIYNFTGQPINLKAETTTLTLGNKSYKLVNDVMGLKPATYKNAKTKEVNLASLPDPIEIIAGAGGEDSNLPGGTRLEITNQVFGSKPQLLYAVTDSEITGGTTRYLSVVSADDIENAKKSLQDKALAEIKQKLEAQGMVLADKSYNFNVTGFSTDSVQGSQTPSFTATLNAQVIGLTFKKEDFSNLIFKRIYQTLSGNKTLVQGSQEENNYFAKTLDLANQLAVLDVHFEGQAIYGVDLANLTPELVGKSSNDVNEILRSKAEIDKVEITLAPSWQTKFPFLASKIKLNVIKPN